MVDDGPRILAGRYEVGELIGRGGMAEVHIGHDTRLGRTVAIKILRSDLARDPSFQNRFRREAQAAAALNHPAIVAVYDTGEDVFTEPTGVVAHVPFIVMEYVEGHTVRDILRDGNAVPIEEAVEITTGVLSALEYSHHAGIVHRDIKPANVMLTPTGAVKVMDFGIARAVADSAATMTQTQAVIGTAQYLSPEQARGETVDARSDLYSTGCLLFELLTGRPPFIGDSPVAVAYQHVREVPPAPSTIASDVPEPLDRITLKALSKEREARYSTAAEFRSDLEAAMRGATVTAPPVGAAVPVPVAAAETTQVLTPATATQHLPPAAPPWAATGLGSDLPGQEPEEEPRRRSWLLWLLIAIAVLAVAGIVALLVANSNRDAGSDTVTVPPLVGLTEQEARDAVDEADLIWQRAQEPSTEVDEGHVTRSDPAEGTEVDKESPIKVYISTGPASATVPDVSGRSQQEAEQLLKDAGLTVDPTREQEDNPDFPEGQVTKTDPPANETVPAGSAVKLFVSSGNVVVPKLVGMTEADARAALNALHLQANTREEETDQATPGTVTAQDRPENSLVGQGTVVNLTIAVAPPTATVPDNLAGMTYDQAVQALRAVGLNNINRVDEYSEAQPDGAVIYTDPTGATEVPLDQQIDVHVSRGPQPDPSDSPGGGGGGNGGGNNGGGNGGGNNNGGGNGADSGSD